MRLIPVRARAQRQNNADEGAARHSRAVQGLALHQIGHHPMHVVHLPFPDMAAEEIGVPESLIPRRVLLGAPAIALMATIQVPALFFTPGFLFLCNVALGS